MFVVYGVLEEVSVEGVLDVKICELIFIVVVIIICCDGCIGVYIEVVLKVGVSEVEIVQILVIVIFLNVGVVYVYLLCVLEVYEQFKK